MKTVIYADILIVINIIVNYLLLRASSMLAGSEFKALNMLASSALGGLFSLFIFVDGVQTALSIIVKIVMLVLMILIAGGRCSLKLFLKNAAAFIFSNFVFAGIMLALCVSVFPDYILFKNGIVYFDINILTLTVSAVVCYAVLSLLSAFLRSRMPSNCIYDIFVTYKGETVCGKALFDSGNRLCDCYSGLPVVIADKTLISVFLKDGKTVGNLDGFRMVPFSVIGKSGVLPAFKADEITVHSNGRELYCDSVIVAVAQADMMSAGYSALIGTPFSDRAKEKNHARRK